MEIRMKNTKRVALSFLAILPSIAFAGPIALLKDQPLTNQWQTFESDSSFSNAAIFSSMNVIIENKDTLYEDYTFNIKNVVSGNGSDKGSFQARVDWDSANAPETSVNASFLIAQQGVYTIGGSVIEVGTINSSPGEFQYQFTTEFLSRPLLLLEQQTKQNEGNANSYELTKASETTSSGFTAVRQQSNNALSSSLETTAYIAVSKESEIIEEDSATIVLGDLLSDNTRQAKYFDVPNLSEFVFFSEINGVPYSPGAVTDTSQYTQSNSSESTITGFINEGANRDGRHTVEHVSLIGFRIESTHVDEPRTLFLMFISMVLFRKRLFSKPSN